MATKQGLTASLYQQTEDAKRAIVSRSKSSWFSNLNTTCTIKSAPPRTPDVLQGLACHSGYLIKRNEQHVWQTRWCCVVPHHFLYYFDDTAGVTGTTMTTTTMTGITSTTTLPMTNGIGASTASTPSNEQQEAFNAAVTNNGRKHAPPRSSLHLFSPATINNNHNNNTHHYDNYNNNNNNNSNNGTIPPPTEKPMIDPSQLQQHQYNHSFKTLQPAGIIDLECYTSVHKNATNPWLLELAGDETLNPELRSFYFVAADEESGEEWTRAFLSGRHAALVDEREAYRQVCDGFAEQLQQLHTDLDEQQKQVSDAKDENYRIRSVSEETRRQIVRKVQHVLERDQTLSIGPPKQRTFRMELEDVRNQDLGGLAAVQVLSDYTQVLELACAEAIQKEQLAQQQLQQGADLGLSRTKELEELLQQKEQQHQVELEHLQAQFKNALDRLVQSQTALQDKQQQLQSQKMEFSMYQSSMKAKLGEVNSHKKILKKEVIDLRNKLDEVGSELSLLKHNSSRTLEQVDVERRKSELLEKYVGKMETQVKVQQNMMDIMSQSGYGGSQYGATSTVRTFHSRGDPTAVAVETTSYGNGFGPRGSSPRDRSDNSSKADRVVVNSPSAIDEDDDNGVEETHSQMLRHAMAEEDNKSHMSELTEDRTHKNWDFPDDSTSLYRKQMKRPPSFIGVDHLEGSTTGITNMDHRDTINSSVVSLPPTRPSSVSRTQQVSSGDSVSSSGRLSVAQRARVEADRVPSRSRTLPSGRSPQKKVIAPSFLATLGKQLAEAIDNSVLGVPDIPAAEPYRSQSPESVASEVESEVPVSQHDVLSQSSTLSLADRQQMQRATQIAFLKGRGLLKNDTVTKKGTDPVVFSR